MLSQEHQRQRENEAARPWWVKVAVYVFCGALILVSLAWIARDAGAEVKSIETWIAGWGVLGPIVFACLVVVLSSVFVPSTLLAAMSGALFGLGAGTITMVAGSLIAAAINFAIASTLLRNRISELLQRYPKLLAIQRAVQREGWRLQFMLRLAPINSVSVNYVLGAAGVRFWPYLMATVGMVPGLFMEVYFGHLAKHVTKTAAGVDSYSMVHHLLTYGGFALGVVVMIYLARIAQRTLADAEADSID